MKTRINLLVAALLIVGLFAAILPVHDANAKGLNGKYIIVFKNSVKKPTEKARGLALAHGLELNHVYSHALKGFAARFSANRLARLQADPNVAYIIKDQVVSIAAPRGNGGKPGGGKQPPQELPTGIDRIDGALSSVVANDHIGSVDVDVAVIDTGIDIDHPDLNVVGGVNCSKGRSYDDGHGHGTHVAGTIGALDNAIGVVGVAPGARLWAVRVLDNRGSGWRSDIICGIDWVTAHADIIEVANMSLGGGGSDPNDSDCSTEDAEHDAICRSVAAGVTYAVAAGNETDDSSNHVPAAYDEVITVSALADFDGLSGAAGSPTCREDEDDTLANFSNFGVDVDIIAPGVCILSTWDDGGYNTISGTSMASPHVAGAAALYLANNPGASPSQVKHALLSNGTTDWDNSDDGDSTKEPLLNVSNF